MNYDQWKEVIRRTAVEACRDERFGTGHHMCVIITFVAPHALPSHAEAHLHFFCEGCDWEAEVSHTVPVDLNGLIDTAES